MSNSAVENFVAVVGAKALVAPFKMVGAKTFAVDAVNHEAQAREVFEAVVGAGNFPLVFLTAETAAVLKNELTKERRRGVVALSVLPSPGAGDEASAAQFLRDMAERALGTDILK